MKDVWIYIKGNLDPEDDLVKLNLYECLKPFGIPLEIKRAEIHQEFDYKINGLELSVAIKIAHILALNSHVSGAAITEEY